MEINNQLEQNQSEYNHEKQTLIEQNQKNASGTSLHKVVVPEEYLVDLHRFLDEEGRLTLFPSKRRNKTISLFYLATLFEPGIIYTEKQVNEIIEAHHTFQDKWLLRRELIEHHLLCRLADGSQYWLAEELPLLEDSLTQF